MSKTKTKQSIDERRKKVWKKINKKAEKTIGRNKREGENFRKVINDPNPWDHFNGDAELVLDHAARCFKNDKERLQYLQWVLESISRLPKFALWEAQDSEEKRRDAIERMRNPKSFDKSNRYHKVEDPREIIKAEIERLQGRGPRPIGKGKFRNWNFDVLERDQPEKIIQCSALRANMKLGKNTIRGWYRDGRKIIEGIDVREWGRQGYEVASKKGNLLLKTSSGNTTVKMKDLIAFLEFTGII